MYALGPDTKILDNKHCVNEELNPLRDRVYQIVTQAAANPEEFITLAKQDKTVDPTVTFTQLFEWLGFANEEVFHLDIEDYWPERVRKNRFGLFAPDPDMYFHYHLPGELKQICKLVEVVYTKSTDIMANLRKQRRVQQKTTQTIPPTSTTTSTRGQVQKKLEIGGFDALDLTIKKRANLTDPVVDVEVKLNNPLTRIWEAIKRIWKSQKTVVSLRFTIPLLVLPIVIFVGYRLWMGRGVTTPMAKVGIIHEISLNGKREQILVLPTSDVYLLRYSSDTIKITLDSPTVVFGMFNHLDNVLTVEKIGNYAQASTTNTTTSPSSITPVRSGASLINQVTAAIWTPIASFLNLF